MLIEFYGQNFGCFRDEFRLSMLATQIDPDSSRGIVEVKVQGDEEPLRLLRAVAIYGPNASGKSTVLRAAVALGRLIGTTARLQSEAPLVAYDPFGIGASGEPVRLGVKAVVAGHVYDYEIKFDRTEFLSERLTLLHADGEPTVLLDRVGQEVSGQWKDDGQFALLSKAFRPNALLLSLADSLAPSLANNIAASLCRLLRSGPSHGFSLFEVPAARRAADDPTFAGWLKLRLKSADIGISEVRFREEKIRVPMGLSDASEGDGPGGNPNPPNSSRPVRRLSLRHGRPGEEFNVPYGRESLGTQRLVELAPMLYDLERGPSPCAAFVDEIHGSLHPTLLQGIIREFNCQATMADVHGQLIFTTHETSLLDAEAKDALLRRDQIYLTEKNAAGEARLYSVAEFHERNNLNLRRRYLQGRYGALPALGEL